jgi:hypothetical protein
MKIYILLLLTILSSCSIPSEKKCPTEIIKNDSCDLYNNAKWYFYMSNFGCDSLYCEDTHKSYYLKTPITKLDLEAVSYTEYNDTINIGFLLKTGNSECSCKDKNYFDIFIGLKGSDSIIIRSNSTIEINPTIDDIFNNPSIYSSKIKELQSYGIYDIKTQDSLFNAYIQNNKDKLNSWIINEYNRRTNK